MFGLPAILVVAGVGAAITGWATRGVTEAEMGWFFGLFFAGLAALWVRAEVRNFRTWRQERPGRRQ